MVGLAQLLDDLTLIVGVILCDLLGLVGARRLFFKAQLLLGQPFLELTLDSAIGPTPYTHTAGTIGDAPWATTIGSWATGGQAKTDDPEQTPARKKKSY